MRAKRAAVIDEDNSEGASNGEIEFEVSAASGAGERLDRFLARMLPDYSRSRLQRWIALGAVSCENRALAADTRLTGREVIAVVPQPLEADAAFKPEPVDFEVVYEDADLLVVNKPAGLVVHPAPGNWGGTLMNGLLHRFAAQSKIARAGIVHRLDKDTSGLMMVARTEKTREALVTQLSERLVKRRYLSICSGHVKEAFTADGSIGRDRNNRLRMAVVRAGKIARTDFYPLQTGQLDDKAVTLVACQLHTGRTHQIRVHLADAGFPIIGDSLYGGPDTDGLSGQCLHAFALKIIHPALGEPMQWISPPEARIKQVMQQAGLPEPDYSAVFRE